MRERTQQALALRKHILAAGKDTNACRLLFSEADDLPGILADRYNDLILLQLLTQGTAQDDVRAALTEVLRAELKPAAIWERPDPRIRELEQLAPPAAGPLFSSSEERAEGRDRVHAQRICNSATTPPPARRPAHFSISV